MAYFSGKEFPGEIHLLLADVIMLHVSGDELAKSLVSQQPNMKVIYMSGYAGLGSPSRHELEPAVGFLQKPFSPDGLSDVVRKLLAGAHWR